MRRAHELSTEPSGARVFAETLLFLVAAIILGASWLSPLSRFGPLLGWIAVFAFATAAHVSRFAVTNYLIFGIITHGIGFYWLPGTLQRFGGFPLPIVVCLFLAFAVISSLQFVICGMIFSRLRRSFFNALYLALPISWAVTEGFIPRLFPWSLAHTQISWKSFALLASGADLEVLSALMLWFASIVVTVFIDGKISRRMFVCILACASCVMWGSKRRDELTTKLLFTPKVRVVAVQGNVGFKEKRNAQYLEVNIDRYRELSERSKAIRPSLIIWPESVTTYWTPEQIQLVRGSKFDPAPNLGYPLLFGGLTFRERTSAEFDALISRAISPVDSIYRESRRSVRYNSALGIDAKGNVIGRYHKRVLMPFGEYLPLSDRFPKLQELSPQSGDLDSGLLNDPIQFHVQTDEGKSETLDVMPLICYEDLVPWLGREAVMKGATILANLTNDAWYGDTAAPYQHHLIAAWRAIQTQRFLIRSTNTGYSAVVDPLGNTIADLPLFSEGYLFAEVAPFTNRTAYVRYGYIISWMFLALALIGLVVPPLEQEEPERPPNNFVAGSRVRPIIPPKNMRPR